MPSATARAFIFQVLIGTYVGFTSIDGIEEYVLTVAMILILLIKELDDNEYFDEWEILPTDESISRNLPTIPRSVDIPSFQSVVDAVSPRRGVGFSPRDVGAPAIPTIFSSPEPLSGFSTSNMTMRKLQSCFPGALPNKDIVERVTSALKKFNYGRTSLLATSLCCDEVNRDLEKAFINAFGDNFSMGGLAGFAFGGVTSFGAMAHHIPQDGSCLIIFGPHVGIDSNGNVGKINRRGRHASGACCGSAAAAAAYVAAVRRGAPKAPLPKRALDAQQFFVGSMLLPHAERLARANDSDVELPFALYDVQAELMLKIVLKACKEVGGDGKIALLGGIQVNTPGGLSDYFLPKKFEIRNNKGQLLENFLYG